MGSEADTTRLRRLAHASGRLLVTVGRPADAPLIDNWLAGVLRLGVEPHAVFTRDDALFDALSREGMNVFRLTDEDDEGPPHPAADRARVTRRLLALGIDVMMTDPCASILAAPMHHALAAGDFDLYLPRRGRPQRDGDHQTDGRDEPLKSISDGELGGGVYLVRSRELTRRFFDRVVRALETPGTEALEARVFDDALARWGGPVSTTEGRAGPALHVHGLNRAAFPDAHYFTRYDAVGRRYPPPVVVWPGHADSARRQAQALEEAGHWHAIHPAQRRIRRVTDSARRRIEGRAVAVERRVVSAAYAPVDLLQRSYPHVIARRKTTRQREITFCTTCMNRRHDLERTLPKNLADNQSYPHARFLVLDYNSQDNLQEWIEDELASALDSGRLIYVRTGQPEHFHMAHAKNMAHAQAPGDVLCNLDADNFSGRNFAFHVNARLDEDERRVGHFERQKQRIDARVGGRPSGFGGRIYLMRRHFEALGGYDERFVGYGAEDRDFLRRCDRLGLVRDPIPLVFLQTLTQSDDAKMENQPDIDGLRHPTAKRARYLEINERLVEDNDRRSVVRVNPEGFGRGPLEVTVGG